MPPNLVNFGPEVAENGWRVFAHPKNFRTGRHCQPYRVDVIIRQQANCGTCYVVAFAAVRADKTAMRPLVYYF